MRARRWGLLALAAGVLLLSAPAGGASGPRLTTPTKATKEDLEPARTYADPYVLIDPANPLVVLAATVEMRSRACGFFRSTDGGGSWKLLEWLVAKPEDSPSHAQPITSGHVMGLRLVRVPDLLRLRRVDVTALSHRDVVQRPGAATSIAWS